MILVMRPLEIVPSVVERNEIFISSAVCVCWIYTTLNLCADDNFTDHTMLYFLSSSRSCCLITTFIVFNISKCSSGAPPKSLSNWMLICKDPLYCYNIHNMYSGQRRSRELCLGSVELHSLAWTMHHWVFIPAVQSIPGCCLVIL